MTAKPKRGAPRQLNAPRRLNVEIEAAEYEAVEKLFTKLKVATMTEAVRRMFTICARHPDKFVEGA